MRLSWLLGIGLFLMLVAALMWGNRFVWVFAAMDKEATPALFANAEPLSPETVESIVSARYPIGLEHADLVARLEADGFAINAPARADMVWDSGICLTTVVLNWTEAEGLITEISSRLDWGCP